jgi:ATP-binding cassette, subfamily B, bacterial
MLLVNIPLNRYYALLSAYIAPHGKRFALLAILLLSSIGLQLFIPQLTRQFIDLALEGEAVERLVIAAAYFILLALGQQLFSIAAVYVGENLAWLATNELREKLTRHALSLDMTYHNDTNPGAMIERIDGDVVNLSNFFSQLVIQIFGNILLLLGIVAVLFREDWRLGIGFSAFAVAMLFVLNLVRNVGIEPLKKWRDAMTNLMGFIEERLAGTEDIRSSGAVSFVLMQLNKFQYEVRSSQQVAWRSFIIIHGTAGFLMMGGIAASVYAGYTLFQAGLLTVGTVYLVIRYVELLGRPIRELTQQMENLQTVGASMERVEELLAIQPQIKDGKGKIIPEAAISVAFENVIFSYKDDEPVLNCVSFRLEEGNIMGLLGRTGSGKTTIARLLFRLYEQQEGAIKLGDVDIRDATLGQLRQRVAMVTQDVQLFEASIRDNLTFFNRSIDDSRLLSVIEELELKDWFDSLPNGLDTVLETGGRSLSAGEAQLLAFTRVFLRDPGLVILDEASSRLDPATEQLIERAITKLLKGRTGIIIAHRLGTVERAEQILILDDGEILEHGNRSLLASDKASRFYHLLKTGLEEVLV